MNIDFKNFDYELIEIHLNRPQETDMSMFPEQARIDWFNKIEKNDKGVLITIVAAFLVPDRDKNKVLLFEGQSIFLIPMEQNIERLVDNTNEIEDSMILEFAHHHLSGLTHQIFNFTQGKQLITIPSIYDLWQNHKFN